jgi:hypothetical protein
MSGTPPTLTWQYQMLVEMEVVRLDVVGGFDFDLDDGSFESQAQWGLSRQEWSDPVHLVSVSVDSYEKDGLGNPEMVNGGSWCKDRSTTDRENENENENENAWNVGHESWIP